MRIRNFASSLAPALALSVLGGLAGCNDDPGVINTGAKIRVDPVSHDFEAVQLGTSRSKTFVINNDGDVPLTLTVKRGGVFDEASFSFDLQDERVASGGLTTLEVVFTPERLTQYSAELIIESNDDDNPAQSITINGTGVITTLAVSPEELDFRNVVVDTTKKLELTLTNNSDVDADIEYIAGTDVKFCGAGNNDPAAYCVRFLDSQLDANNRFPLSPNQSVKVEVEFSPTVAGRRSDGFFSLKACEADVCDTRVNLTGVGVEAGLRCRPAELDFGQVNPQSQSTMSVTCENIANEQVTITSWALTADSHEDLSVESPRPQVLNENDSVSIEVTFAPQTRGDVTGTLRLETDSADSSVDIAIEGTGGGPDIQVLPPTLNFGRVSLIAPARRNIVIANTGYAPLNITEIQVDVDGTGSFTSMDATAQVLQPQETKIVAIEFTPAVEGEIQSIVRILSNDGDEGTLDVVVRGEGVVLPPCDFTVVPGQLDFGAVQRTRNLQRSFEIHNNGEDICLVTALRMLPGSDPAFTLVDGDVMSLEIGPGSAESFKVQFAPTNPGTHMGKVEFSISSPTSPFNEVDLLGVGADSTLLIVPAELNFGTIGVGCASRARTVTIYNTGSAAVQIDSIELATPVNAAFSIVNRPSPLPGNALSLAPGQSTSFDVGFRADEISAYASAVEINAQVAGQPVTYIVSLDGRGSLDATQIDNFQQLGKPKVDILFVVDKSGSMGEEQDALGQNFQAFIQFAEAQGLEYQLGVTTTDTDDEAGRLSSANAGTTSASSATGPGQNRIVTPQTQPNPSAVFASNISFTLVGGSAADESGLRAAEQALSAPVVFGHNAGFLRQDAVLSIIFISDEPDQSSGSVDFYINFFLSIKGFRNTNLFSASAITAPTPPGSCSGPGGSATAEGRYLAAAERTGGVFQSICTADWSRSLEDLSTTAFGFKSRFFLTNQPVISTLKVFIDDSELPQTASAGTVNWTYDFATNSVNFAPYATPEPGADIRVEYSAECL